MSTLPDSEAQKLAWEVKETTWNKVAHLPLEEAFLELMRQSSEKVASLGLEDRVSVPEHAQRFLNLRKAAG